MHFILEKGSSESPTPLLISHGWPGSVAEFKDIIEPLAHPERFGGNINDAFDVIAPSLPGFAYSGKPNRPMGPRAMASMFNKRWAQRFDQEQIMEEGYRTQQATRPQTLSYAMMDSPVGIAAWLVEKIISWSDVQNNDIESVYSRDDLLTNIMIYVTTRCFTQPPGSTMADVKRVAAFCQNRGIALRYQRRAPSFPKKCWPGHPALT